VLFLKRLAVWLPEILAETLLLGILLGVLALPWTEFVRLFPGLYVWGLAVAVFLFFDGYYATRAFVGLVWRSHVWWRYSTIAATLFVVHAHIVFLLERPTFSPEGRALELPFLACGVCVVFGCTALSGGCLRKWTRNEDATLPRDTVAFVRQNLRLCSSLFGAVTTIALMLAGNAGLISDGDLDHIFSPGLTLASAFHLGAHDFSTASLVFMVNSIIVGVVVYGVAALLKNRTVDSFDDRRSD
jgi:hypothetical protein